MLFTEGGGLAHEAFYDLLVVLAEHGWNWIPLGGEFEEGEEICFFGDLALSVPGGVYV